LKIKQRKKKVGIEACFEWQYPLLSGKILKRSSPRELADLSFHHAYTHKIFNILVLPPG